MKSKMLVLSLVVLLSIALIGCTDDGMISRDADNLFSADEISERYGDNIPISLIQLERATAPRDDVGALLEDSVGAVKGTVGDIRYGITQETPVAVFQFEVSDSWCELVNAGDTITLVKPGGVWSLADSLRNSGRPLETKPTKEQEYSMVEVLVDGAPLPQEGAEMIYFIREPGEVNITELGLKEDFYLVNYFDGEFSLEGDEATRFKFDSAEYELDQIDVGELESSLDKLVTGTH